MALNAQIKKLSVKRITSPVVFDNLKNPVPGGLYDPALGPYDSQGGRYRTPALQSEICNFLWCGLHRNQEWHGAFSAGPPMLTMVYLIKFLPVTSFMYFILTLHNPHTSSQRLPRLALSADVWHLEQLECGPCRTSRTTCFSGCAMWSLTTV